MIKTCGMNILFCLILWTNISHSIITSIPLILKKSSPHINVRRSSKPVPYYHNSSATMWLLLFGEIESNPGPVNPTESNRKRKQNKSFPSFFQECNKTVKANSKRLLCIHSNNLVHLKCIGTNSTKWLKSYDPQRWICCRCYLEELPFFNTQNLSQETISITDTESYRTIQNHTEPLIQNNTEQTFILNLCKHIETILVSHIWSHRPWALHLMNSK